MNKVHIILLSLTIIFNHKLLYAIKTFYISNINNFIRVQILQYDIYEQK